MEKNSTTRFITPTTLGAYFCVSGGLTEQDRAILGWLFTREQSPAFDHELTGALRHDLGMAEPAAAVKALLTRKLVTLSDTPAARPCRPMHEALPSLLARLAADGAGMLSDAQGLCIASTGYENKDSNAVSALGSKLVGALHHGEHGLLDALDIHHGLPCIYDMANKQLISFIPINIGGRLLAVLHGRPVFSGTIFRDLVWTLWDRYGSKPPD